MLDRLVEVGQGGVRVRPLGGNRAGEVRLGRFLHPRVTPAEMIAAAAERTAGQVCGGHILAIQDTTSLRDDGDQRSLHLHPTIAVNGADGARRGLVGAAFLRRDGSKRALKNKRPFDDKESRRWLDATHEAGRLAAAGAACVTMVADRGDLYEEFACRPDTVELLIRAQHDRCLVDGARLYACIDAEPELGREVIELPAGPGRAARTAVLALRARPVTIKRPKRNRASEAAKLPEQVTVWLVDAREVGAREVGAREVGAREVGAPVDATPAHWRRLTTHEVTSLAQAKQITAFYRQRWTIEQLFRVMKTKGFNIEAVRIIGEAAFENLATATLIAAVQVLQMVHERDGTRARPLTDALDPADQPALEAVCATVQGKTERQKNPHARGSLAYATWVCARLGGWTGYYGKPGPVVILQGLLRFKAMRHGWALGRLV